MLLEPVGVLVADWVRVGLPEVVLERVGVSVGVRLLERVAVRVLEREVEGVRVPEDVVVLEAVEDGEGERDTDGNRAWSLAERRS